MVDFLSKERIVARPGFQSLAGAARLRSAIHLSIGMAYGFTRVLAAAVAARIGITKSVACPADMSYLAQVFTATCDWKIKPMLGWMYTLFFVFPGFRGRACGEAGSSESVRAKQVSWRRSAGAADCCISALGVYLHQIWAHVARLRRHRRHRPGPGLHLPGVDADQVVSRPPRHGHRHGDHGLRRRRDDRRAAGRSPDEVLRHGRLSRRVGDLRYDGRHLFRSP